MANRKDPFQGIELSASNKRWEVDFDCEGVLVRATYNYIGVGGRLSRGTIALVDSEGYLMQKDPKELGHAFETSIHSDLIIPVPEENEKQEKIIREHTLKRAHTLISKYHTRLVGAWRSEKNIEKLTLQQALDAHLLDYLADRSNSDRGQQESRHKLESLAVFWDGRTIEKINVKDIKEFINYHKAQNAQGYIIELDRFICDVAYRIGTTPPNKAIEKYLEQSNAESNKKKMRKWQKDAANADILPKAYEDELDRKAWECMGDPMWAALMMIKESGLPTADICRLKIGDFERNKDDEEQVYVLYRRDDLKTATRDYTFALSPCGGLYCNRYIAYLAASGEERLQAGKYLLSSDPEGNCALVPSEVNKYVRTQLNAARYGYAGYAKISDNFAASQGSALLRATREKHLNEDCGFSKDPGARCYMLHRALTAMVQADHYRSFSDPTGRNYLWRLIRQDRHGIPKKQDADDAKTPRRTSRVQRGENDELRFRGTDAKGEMQVIVQCKNIKEGDVIEVISEGGCYLEIVE